MKLVTCVPLATRTELFEYSFRLRENLEEKKKKAGSERNWVRYEKKKFGMGELDVVMKNTLMNNIL